MPTPTHRRLELLLRHCAARGVPLEDAEDIVVRAWEKAEAAFDPNRGSFDALVMRVVDNDCRYFWRRARRAPVPLTDDAGLTLVPDDGPERERAAALQARLLDALSDDERRVFGVWALQHHLPRGRLTGEQAARSLERTPAEFENAKRRLRTRIAALLADWGLEPRDFYSVREDEHPRKRSGRP